MNTRRENAGDLNPKEVSTATKNLVALRALEKKTRRISEKKNCDADVRTPATVADEIRQCPVEFLADARV